MVPTVKMSLELFCPECQELPEITYKWTFGGYIDKVLVPMNLGNLSSSGTF